MSFCCCFHCIVFVVIWIVIFVGHFSCLFSLLLSFSFCCFHFHFVVFIVILFSLSFVVFIVILLLLFSSSCCILSLQFYNENTLSILFKYTFKLPEVTGSTNSTTEKDRYATHSILSQLPIMGVTSLLSCDGDEGSVAKDIGSLLTQVHNLGSFKAGKLAVGGNRKVAAVVSMRLYVYVQWNL